MSIPPRARFYALLCVQVGGALIIFSGMSCYWFRLKGGAVNGNITWRTGSLTGLMLVTAALPLILSVDWRALRKQLARRKANPRETFADRSSAVRTLVWFYCFADLFLLTYLVHITGGISGSMFAGVYLAIPAIALLLIDDLLDVKIVLFLIMGATVGIILSYLMSSLPYLEGFKASQYEKAFDISLGLVTTEAMLIPLGQIAILWSQLEGEIEIEN